MYNYIYISIIFWCIIIFFLNYKVYEEFQSGYRLGDMILLSKSNKWSRYNTSSGFDYHLRHYPNSIATEYMLKTNQPNDYNTLIKIIQTRKITNIYNNYLIIHLRLGDVIKDSPFSIYELLYSNKTNHFSKYIKQMSYYQNISNLANKYNIKKIVIVTGFHTKGPYTKSYEYINKVKSFFEKNGFQVSIRIDNNPDDDFLLMCNAKYFTPSGGGFSRVIKNIVQRRGGIIIE
jgi:hypothetical protein